jgi:hypothetical protein
MVREAVGRGVKTVEGKSIQKEHSVPDRAVNPAGPG